MKNRSIIILAISTFFFISWSIMPGKPKEVKPSAPPVAEKPVQADLTAEYSKKIHKISDNVYSAVGFGLANSIMIEGNDGLIIVDTMESNQAAATVLAEFRKISQKPVKAIIYTHNHVDHVMGAKTMTGGGNPDVYAHDTTDLQVRNLMSRMRPIISARSLRMFGGMLNQDDLVHSGIGPVLRLTNNSTTGYIRPNKTFSDKLETTVCGIKLILLHAPGETDDQIYVWLPDKRVLLSGDNYYTSFPNLYTIRGTTFRSIENWYRSIDMIRDIWPEYLVPSHGSPLSGGTTIYTMMTNYRDAIQYVHDQGIRAINQGLTPDELAETIKLPDHLANLPYLQEVYGKVSWSVRSLFDGNLGWFNGDSADLQPLSRKDKARMMADIAGGLDKLVTHSKRYADSGNFQAALELTGHILRLDPSNKDARSIRITALENLGRKEKNVNARHYYLTEALEIKNGKPATLESKITPEQLSQFPIDSFMAMLPVNLNAQAAADIVKTAGIRFTDENRDFTIVIRKGVAEIRNGLPQDADILVIAKASDFKAMMTKIKNPLSTLSGFDYKKGSSLSFGNFLKLFQPPVQKLAYQPL